jgi:hypothetical protein
VADNVIRLSDLLPEDAPEGLREQAYRIELGRSPQCRTPRVLQSGEIARRLGGHAGLEQLVSIPERITVERQGQRISGDLVRRAIDEFLAMHPQGSTAADFAGLKVLGAPEVSASAPPLRVEAARWDRQRNHLEFVIACVHEKTCGRFLAVADLPDAGPHPENFLPGPRPRANAGAPPPILARAGSAAMMNMEDGRIHIELRVICLQPGALGQTIRAREADGLRIYRAQVTGAGTLRARL